MQARLFALLLLSCPPIVCHSVSVLLGMLCPALYSLSINEFTLLLGLLAQTGGVPMQSE